MHESSAQTLGPASPGRRPEGHGSGAAVRRAGRVLTAVAGVRGDGAFPGALLQRADVRGAWSRSGRWSVYGGTAATLEVDGTGTDRFRAVARRTGELTGESGGGPAVRFYGGFAFHDDHRARGPWAAFPGARFELPAWEVRHGEDGSRAVVHRVLAPDEDPRSPGEALLGDLRELVASAERALGAEADTLAASGALSGENGGPGGSRLASRLEQRLEAPAGDGGREAWLRSVEDALRWIDEGRLEKVVLARCLDVTLPRDGRDAFRALAGRADRSGAYLFSPSGGTDFAGASPELLAAVAGRSFRATAVAGSIRRGRDAAEDEELARRLLESAKDRREQAIVAEEIRERLEARGLDVELDTTHVLRLPRIQHLETRVRAPLPRRVHVLDLLAELHPTPAVCGRPRSAALDFLREAEHFERGWYAGPVGWFDGRGDGEFVPALRSGLRHDGRWRLFAGCGIVPGSVPEAEWEETALKFRAVMRAFLSKPAGVPSAPD